MSIPATQFPSDNNLDTMPNTFRINADVPGDGTGYPIAAFKNPSNNKSSLAVSASSANSPASINSTAFTANGKVAVILNQNGIIGDSPQSLSNIKSFQIEGGSDFAYLGRDFDIDSSGNMIVGSFGAYNFKGEVSYIPAAITQGNNVKLATTTPPNAYKINATLSGGYFGYTTRIANGMDGTTNKQLLFCAPLSDVCYIAWLPDFLQVAGHMPLASMNSTYVLKITGKSGTYFGLDARAFDDIGTGKPAVIFGAPYGANLNGELFVLYASPTLRQLSTFNITQLNGPNGFAIRSDWTGGQLGFPGIAVGTFNNRTALVVNAPFATHNGNVNAGITAVIFTYPGMASSGVFNLSTLNGTNGCTLGGNTNDRAGYALTPLNLDNNKMGLFLGAPGMVVNDMSDAGGGYYVTAICQTAIMDLPASIGNGTLRFNGSSIASGNTGGSVASGDYNLDGIEDIAIGGVDKVVIVYGDATPFISNTTVYITQNSTTTVTFIKVTLAGQTNPNITLLLHTSSSSYFSLRSNPLQSIKNCTLGQQLTNQLLLTADTSRTAPTCSIAAESPKRFAPNAQPVPCIVNFSLLPPYLANNTVLAFPSQSFPVTTDNIGPEELGLDRMPDDTRLFFTYNDPNSKFCKGGDTNSISTCILGEMRPNNSSITFTSTTLAPAVSVTILTSDGRMSASIPLRFITTPTPEFLAPPYMNFNSNDVSKIFVWDAQGNGGGNIRAGSYFVDDDSIEFEFANAINNHVANRLLPGIPIPLGTPIPQKDFRLAKIGDYLPQPAALLYPNISLSVRACATYNTIRTCSAFLPITMGLVTSSSAAVPSSSAVIASSSAAASSSAVTALSSSAVAEAAGSAAAEFPTWAISLITTPIGLCTFVAGFYIKYKAKATTDESTRTLAQAIASVQHKNWNEVKFRNRLFTPLIEDLFEAIDTKKCLRVRDDATNLAYFLEIKNIIDHCGITEKYFTETLSSAKRPEVISTIIDCIVFYASHGWCGKPSMSPQRLHANATTIANDIINHLAPTYEWFQTLKDSPAQQLINALLDAGQLFPDGLPKPETILRLIQSKLASRYLFPKDLDITQLTRALTIQIQEEDPTETEPGSSSHSKLHSPKLGTSSVTATEETDVEMQAMGEEYVENKSAINENEEGQELNRKSMKKIR